jgi:peptidase E
LEDFVLGHDIVYVGGGNTRSMLALWREWKIDVYLRAAWEKGTVLAGISAGSICWFEEGLSDFLPGELNRLECLGFLPGSNCPHYDGEADRRPAYHRLILSGEMSAGVAAEDDVALHYVDTKLQSAVTARPGARAYSVRKAGEIIEEETLETINLREF